MFGYSDEDGTEAAGYPDKVPPDEVRTRVTRISALVDELVGQRAEDRIGTEVEVLVEAAEDEDFECTGRAAHQAPEVDGECVLERGSDLAVGDLVRAVVVDTEGADLVVSPAGAASAQRAPPDRRGCRGCRVSSAPAGQPPLLNIANMLTGVRLLLVPVFLVALFVDGGTDTGWRLVAFAVFVVAALTDRLDGELARRRGLVTAFGTMVDPIADKALIGSALIGLSLLGLVPWWATVLIMGREIGVTMLRLWVLRHGVIPASRGGKAKTFVQSLAIGLFLLPLPDVAGGGRAALDGAGRGHRVDRGQRAGLRAARVAAAARHHRAGGRAVLRPVRPRRTRAADAHRPDLGTVI